MEKCDKERKPGFVPVLRVMFRVSFFHPVTFDITSLLGALAKLLKSTVSFVMSVRLSVKLSAWDNSAPTGRISMKFDIRLFFENLSTKFKFY